MSILRIAAVLFGLIAGTAGMLIGMRESYRAAGPLMEDVALAVALVVCGTAAIAWALWSWRRQSGRTKGPATCAVVIAVCVVVVWGVLWPKYGREVCGAWQLRPGSHMRGIVHMMMEATREDTAAALPSASALFVRYGAEVLVDNYCTCMTSRDIQAGAWTYADVLSGRVTVDAFVAAIEGDLDPDQAWERVGMFVFSRDRRALTSFNPAVIVAYYLPPCRNPHETVLVVLADSSVHGIYGRHADELERHLAEMREQGFFSPPDDLAAHGRARWNSR